MIRGDHQGRQGGWLAFAFVGLLVIAACSDEPTAGSEVLPFSEVQETEFSFEADPTNPDRGIFRVTTTEP
jgi:hypothetical protein